MKISIQTLLAAAAMLLPLTSKADIETVPFVDPAKYAGTWYQISHIPMFFEGTKPCACAVQKLTPGDAANTLNVYNSCHENDPTGKLKDISGVATSDDAVSNSKFTVDFGLPWKGTYWIVGLDRDYRYAVVTDKKGKSLYILSRTPELAPELYQEAVAVAKKNQLKVDDLEVTQQAGCTY